MERRITGFSQDQEGHWVALLDCGHTQHLRHDPPWQLRPWGLQEATRREHLDTPLTCILCDFDRGLGAGAEAYDDARMRGLCHDGADEVARRRGEPRVDRGGFGTDPPRRHEGHGDITENS